MHAVIRSYSGAGAKALFDVLEQNKAEVEKHLRTARGFVSYALVRTDDGGFTVTICNDKSGTDESVQKAKEWVQKNAGNIGAPAPKITEGAVVIHAT